MTMPTPQEMDAIIDYHERQIRVFLDGGPDPRGPDRTTPHFLVSWPTRPLWLHGRHLYRLARLLSAVGYESQSARASQIVADLTGRSQSPEELASMVVFIEEPPTLMVDLWHRAP